MNGDLIRQISRFVVVGFINTGIDFGVLNLLMFLTSIYSGRWIILLNSVSFTVAVINSYLWNKYWTFKKEGSETKQVAKEFSQFLIISIIGISLNSGIVYGITTLIKPVFGFSSVIWANLAKAFATGVAMTWNFIGYKFIVFKK